MATPPPGRYHVTDAPPLFQLTASYDVGAITVIGCDSEQECRNELVDVMAAAERDGRAVVAWNIAPVERDYVPLELDSNKWWPSKTTPTTAGIVPRHTAD